MANPKTMIQMRKKRDQNTWKSNEIKLDYDAIKISNDQLKNVQRVEDSIELYFKSTSEVRRNERNSTLFEDFHSASHEQNVFIQNEV